MNAVHSIDAPVYMVTPAGDEDSIIDTALAILASRVRIGPVMDNARAVRAFMAVKAARHADREVFSVMFLDSQHRLIEFREMFQGTLAQTTVYPREVARAALQLNASAVILTHNHPSGSTHPSRADEQLTTQLKTALRLLDIAVIDHIITGGGTSLSMAELGLM